MASINNCHIQQQATTTTNYRHQLHTLKCQNVEIHQRKCSPQTSGQEPSIRVIKLRQNELNNSNAKLGFSLRGGKELTGNSVGVFVCNVEQHSEAQIRGLRVGDQLIQVNGHYVEQASYDQVIGWIRETPKGDEIALSVANLGRIPVQEKLGDPIGWLQVKQTETGAEAEAEAEAEAKVQMQMQMQVIDKMAPSFGKQFDIGTSGSNKSHSNISRSSSGDEGIESCGSHRSSEWESSAAEPSPMLANCQHKHSSNEPLKALNTSINHKSMIHISKPEVANLSPTSRSSSNSCALNDNVSLTSDLSSKSINSSHSNSERSDVLAASSAGPLIMNGNQTNLATVAGQIPTKLILVPGNNLKKSKKVSSPAVKTTNPGVESFGCGVVRGPAEWPGIYVQTVRPASLAARVGLEPGDQIVSAQGDSLDKLSFESAVNLIKRLQLEERELRLEVRKGAALRCLEQHHRRLRRIQLAPSLASLDEHDTQPVEFCSSFEYKWQASQNASDNEVASCSSIGSIRGAEPDYATRSIAAAAAAAPATSKARAADWSSTSSQANGATPTSELRSFNDKSKPTANSDDIVEPFKPSDAFEACREAREALEAPAKLPNRAVGNSNGQPNSISGIENQLSGKEFREPTQRMVQATTTSLEAHNNNNNNDDDDDENNNNIIITGDNQSCCPQFKSQSLKESPFEIAKASAQLDIRCQSKCAIAGLGRNSKAQHLGLEANRPRRHQTNGEPRLELKSNELMVMNCRQSAFRRHPSATPEQPIRDTVRDRDRDRDRDRELDLVAEECNQPRLENLLERQDRANFRESQRDSNDVNDTHAASQLIQLRPRRQALKSDKQQELEEEEQEEEEDDDDEEGEEQEVDAAQVATAAHNNMESPKIRFVSQNCKLHQHKQAARRHKVVNLLHDIFPKPQHEASQRRQAKASIGQRSQERPSNGAKSRITLLPNANAASCNAARNPCLFNAGVGVATLAGAGAGVQSMNRHNSPMIQRHLSVDNLATSNRLTSCQLGRESHEPMYAYAAAYSRRNSLIVVASQQQTRLMAPTRQIAVSRCNGPVIQQDALMATVKPACCNKSRQLVRGPTSRNEMIQQVYHRPSAFTCNTIEPHNINTNANNYPAPSAPMRLSKAKSVDRLNLTTSAHLIGSAMKKNRHAYTRLNYQLDSKTLKHPKSGCETLSDTHYGYVQHDYECPYELAALAQMSRKLNCCTSAYRNPNSLLDCSICLARESSQLANNDNRMLQTRLAPNGKQQSTLKLNSRQQREALATLATVGCRASDCSAHLDKTNIRAKRANHHTRQPFMPNERLIRCAYSGNQLDSDTCGVDLAANRLLRSKPCSQVKPNRHLSTFMGIHNNNNNINNNNTNSNNLRAHEYRKAASDETSPISTPPLLASSTSDESLNYSPDSSLDTLSDYEPSYDSKLKLKSITKPSGNDSNPTRANNSRPAVQTASRPPEVRRKASPPCPPPPPARDSEFERTIERKMGPQQARTGSELRPNQRLCFVDELKLLAKQQPKSTASRSQHSPELQSSTLIKMINASKPAPSSGPKRSAANCAFCSNNNTQASSPGSGRAQAKQQQQQPANETSNGNGNGKIQPEAARCSKCNKCSKSQHSDSNQISSQIESTSESPASLQFANANGKAKLEGEADKRRQHELLMKEFKSVHSKMFNKRKLSSTSNDEQTDQQS